jgi:mono/diheme cytochrome c family protein
MSHLMKGYLYIFLLVGSLLFAAQANGQAIPTDDAAISSGLALFNKNCQQCHAVNEQVVGPALKNVYERRNVPWLINFIKYPQKVIDGGDAYAQDLYKKYKQYMPNHDFLKDEEILQILAYVQDHTKNASKYEATTGGGGGETGGTKTEEAGVSSGLLRAVIIGLLVLLAGVLAVMTLLVNVLVKNLSGRKDISEDDATVVAESFSLKKFLTSPAFTGITAFVLIAVAGQMTIDGLFTVGVHQGYAPDQPIKFSHKLHAGYYEIDCKYCHTGVEKGKSANIPSANICMNCHNAIKTTSPEIQKIYTAIEKNEPIQWVRIHNLPDLSYFNHAQHVKVGGLDCENCHGDIKNMEVVQQHSLLTMGWCIDCHRKTEVKMDNKYYENLVKMHQAESKEPLHVEDIGGLECAKCHY